VDPEGERPESEACRVSFPAFAAFFADAERTVARICVYMALQPPFLSHACPRAVKVSVVQSMARVSTRSVVDALAWLERKGYVVVHGRDRRGTPSLSLAWALPEADQSQEAAS
jgi:hypothetical protein